MSINQPNLVAKCLAFVMYISQQSNKFFNAISTFCRIKNLDLE